jgi:hypothetical protein
MASTLVMLDLVMHAPTKVRATEVKRMCFRATKLKEPAKNVNFAFEKLPQGQSPDVSRRLAARLQLCPGAKPFAKRVFGPPPRVKSCPHTKPCQM